MHSQYKHPVWAFSMMFWNASVQESYGLKIRVGEYNREVFGKKDHIFW